MTPIYRPEIAEFLENIHTVCGPALRLERDPLAVVRRYSAPADLEIAALICSTLAFGSVDLILRACDQALAPLGARPAEALLNMGARKIEESWARFQYRFCFPKDMIGLMRGAQGALREHGSLQALFLAGDDPEKPLTEALSSFVTRLRGYSAASTAFSIRPNLLPDPAQGSACKRLFLFLRWMVRQDDVDPGGWSGVSPAARGAYGYPHGGNLRPSTWLFGRETLRRFAEPQGRFAGDRPLRPLRSGRPGQVRFRPHEAWHRSAVGG